MARRRARTHTEGPLEAALSIVAAYVVTVLLVALTAWNLFLWRRPDDPGGAMIYDALHGGFYLALSWLVLIVCAIVIGVFLARSLWARGTGPR